MAGRIRAVPKARYSVYWRKAKELHQAAETLLASGLLNAAALDAVHAAISALDAVCIYHLGQRSVGQDHREALRMATHIPGGSPGDLEGRFAALLDQRRLAAYEDRETTRAEAQDALRSARRLLGWAQRLLPQDAGRMGEPRS